MTNPTPQKLSKVLQQYFSLSELKTLAFELEIPYEDLAGSTRALKTIELVQYAQRHGRTHALLNYIRRVRPNAGLGAAPAADDDPAPQSQPAAPGGTPTTVYNIQGDFVGGDKTGGDKVGGDKISVGDISNSSGVAIGRDASAEVNIHAPQDKAAFEQQLAELRALLEQAIAAGEIDREDGETVLEDLGDVVDETAKETPRKNRMKRRLEDVGEIVEAARKTGTAVLKATPILAGLIKAISVIF